MYSEVYEFLRSENNAYRLNSRAISRIMARGLGQDLSKTHPCNPLPTLVNSQLELMCSDVDISTVRVAYGRWALPKLKKDILSNDPLESKRALIALLDLVYDPEKAVEAIRLKIFPRLVRLMVSKEPFVRQCVLKIIEVLAMQPSGKLAIVKHKNIVNNLLTLLYDEDTSVRLSATHAVLSLATWYFAIEEMIKQNFISTIINRLDTELETDIMLVLLETLELLLDNDMAAKETALENNGIELAVLLEHPLAEISALAAAVLAQLAQHLQGKRAVLDHRSDILATATRLLDDEEVSVKSNATAVLMFTLVSTEAKLRVMKLPTTQRLLHNAEMAHHHPILQVYSFKALTSIAESPSGQQFLKNNLPLLKNIRTTDSLAQTHKDTLLSVVLREI